MNFVTRVRSVFEIDELRRFQGRRHSELFQSLGFFVSHLGHVQCVLTVESSCIDQASEIRRGGNIFFHRYSSCWTAERGIKPTVGINRARNSDYPLPHER